MFPIHPFPARMAPDLVRRALANVGDKGRVLDPMCGSGTVVRAAVEAGLRCSGVDIDPLAVLMSRVWTTRLSPARIQSDAEDLVRTAKKLSTSEVDRPSDMETKRFVSYWFARPQRHALARLATALRRRDEPTADALAIALSRIIVSKEMMASLARDTSHSRPHKVAVVNDFDAYAGFVHAAALVAKRLRPELIQEKADVQCGDARTLENLDADTFNLAVTSPPYLNAIDYLRGHRLALVWLGYGLGRLRDVRATSVGAERMMEETEGLFDVSPYVTAQGGLTIANRYLGWVRRYAMDMGDVLWQLARVVKRDGRVVMVLGNSFLRGAVIDNAKLVEVLAEERGFRLEDRSVRNIPARRRYLPPPGDGKNALDARMRKETVLAFSVG